MSTAANPPDQPSASKPAGQGARPRLPKQVVQDAKRDLFRGTSPAATDTRFRKGQSGNPAGRPKKPRETAYDEALLPSYNTLLDELDRLVAVREGDSLSRISTRQAVSRAQATTAMKGNAHAQRDILNRADRAERHRAQEIARSNANWDAYKERCAADIAAAERNGTPPPRHLPHPDDILIRPGRDVLIIGPLTEADLAATEQTCALRGALILQDVSDQRDAQADRDQRPGSALLYALLLNDHLPQRFRIGDDTILMRQARHHALPRRDLIRTLYRQWRTLGFAMPRGTVLPPISEAKALLALLSDLLHGYRDGSLSLHDLARGILNDTARALMDAHRIRY